MVPTKDDRDNSTTTRTRFSFSSSSRFETHHSSSSVNCINKRNAHHLLSCFELFLSRPVVETKSEKEARAIPLFANGIYFPPFKCALWHFETHQVFHTKAEGNIQSIIGFKSNHSHDHSWLVPARPVTASQITNQRQSFVIRCIRITNASKIFTKSCKEILWTWWSSRCGDEKHLYFKKIFLKITSRVVIKWSSCS